MNIVIAGGSGFIGAKVKESLRSNGYRVFSLSRSGGRHEDDLKCDITSNTQLEDITVKLSNYKISVLVNFCSRVMSSDTEPDTLFDSNLKIAFALANLAEKLLPEKLVNASSTAIYPNITGSFSETSIAMPSVNSDSWYGLSKFVTENLIDIKLIPLGVVCVHLRICQVYGKGMGESRIIPVLREELRSNGTMTLWGNGERVIPFIEVEKLLVIVTKFVENDCIGGVFNVVGEHLNLVQLANRIALQQKIENHKIILLSKGNKSKFRVETDKLKHFLNASERNNK
tara:strand:+ start:7955 stop:8809 length:855 start_codon:yes stop_codon:yes gene_type:complete